MRPPSRSNKEPLEGEGAISVWIDPDICQGHGRCYSIAPQVFRPDESDGHAVVEEGVVDGVRVPSVLRAVQACPEQAIRTSDVAREQESRADGRGSY